MARYEVQEGERLLKIAKRHGLKLRDLIALNPELADNPQLEPGQRIRLGRGVDALGPDGKPVDDGFLANPGDPSNDPENDRPQGILGEIDPDEDMGDGMRRVPGSGVAWQDPDFLAFMNRMKMATGRIRNDRGLAIQRLRDRFDRDKVLYGEQKREGRTNINDDYSGRGMYFSGGRQRDITDLVAKVNRTQQTNKQNMRDNILDIRTESQRGIADWQMDREEERLKARERQTQLDLQMATGQA